MIEDEPDAPEPRRFAVKGWHGESVVELAIASPNDVACARKIISTETTAIGARAKKIEAGLTKGDRDQVAFEASKMRHHFDLDLSEISNTPLGEWRKKYAQETEAPRHWSVPRKKMLKEWLTERYVSGGAFVTIGTFDGIDTSFLADGGFGFERILPGEGEVSWSYSGNPDRYRPQNRSFAHWLSVTPFEQRQRFVGYVLGAGTGLLDCRLLARRLHRYQIVCTHPQSEAAKFLRSAWEGEIFEWPEMMVCASPGPKYLDPGQLTPGEVARIKWPKVSVVTVSFNQGQYLEDCLELVLGQRYPNLEYIVVDGGSTDGSAEILRRYESRLSKLIIEPDDGQSDGLNKGFSYATGEILTWINSDDMLAPDALRRGVLAMLDNDSDLLTGGCRRITEVRDEVLFEHQPAIPYGRKVPLGFIEQFLWTTSWEKGDYFFQPEVLFSAEAWRRSGGFLKLHLHWAMDWELWIRMGLAGASISHIPEIIGYSRVHPHQKTTADEKYIYQLLNILLEHDDALEALPENVADGTASARLPNWIRLADVRIEGAPRRSVAHILRRLPRVVMRIWHRHRYRVLLGEPLSAATPYAIDWPDPYGRSESIADFCMRLLFGEKESTPATKSIVAEVAASDGDLYDTLREIAIHFPNLHNRPSFSAVKRVLKTEMDLPADLGSEVPAEGYTIIDVGAEPLAFEEHIYAGLLAHRSSHIIAFDPMDKEAPRVVTKGGDSGRPKVEVRIFPDFILDGNTATFHLARMQATSSTLPPNMKLAERFSLLAPAVETFESRPVTTSRLDDILEKNALGTAPIDFLKVDVQGATMPVLKGAPETLSRTLICHLEAEFSELYKSEELFSSIDQHMRTAGFGLLDLTTIGRQRYNAFDSSRERVFHAGRILWADCIYVRSLDEPEKLTDDELLKFAEIAHLIYKKYDVAAFALQQLAGRHDTSLFTDYLSLWRRHQWAEAPL